MTASLLTMINLSLAVGACGFRIAVPAMRSSATVSRRFVPVMALGAVKPAADDWEGGSKQLVTWNFKGAVPSVDIDLYQTDSFYPFHPFYSFQYVTSLALRIQNRGSHEVEVPVGLTPGKYYLKIESTRDDRIFADSRGFIIDKTATPPEISDVAFEKSTSPPPEPFR